MNIPAAIPPKLPKAPSPQKTLRRLFLTLFLRGRSARGLHAGKAPNSIIQKLWLNLGIYGFLGVFALAFLRQTVFALSVYLHASTFAFLGMFLASSAGEVLFNKEEADILLHRPIDPKVLLWSKIRVLIEASLWIAGAFNLVGFFVGIGVKDGSVLYLPAHLISVTLEALFCAGCVVMCYQLCLRWFGRERLDNLITMAQVFVAVGAMLAGQILPRLIFRMDRVLKVDETSWWIMFLPPAWFAGLDDAIGGQHLLSSWMLAGLAVGVTALVLWFAFLRLATSYQAGVQTLSETVLRKKEGKRAGRRWINVMVERAPLKWWLRNPVERASFLLVTAYLFRDRDVKLRVYPALAPILIMPIVMLTQGNGREDFGMGEFMVAFVGSFLGMMPMQSLMLLQYSQQWQATDVFRAAPMYGPAPLCHGARRAVLLVLMAPLVSAFAIVCYLVQRDLGNLVLFLPGIIAMPVYGLLGAVFQNGIPFSLPTEEAKNASRGLAMVGIMFSSFALSGLAAAASALGWFYWFLIAEFAIAVAMYCSLRVVVDQKRWPRPE